MDGDPISDSVHYDRGYDKGYEAGRRRAFELVGQLGDFYEKGVGISKNAPDEEKRLHENSRRNQVNACRYAQHVIRKNSFGEEDLPW